MSRYITLFSTEACSWLEKQFADNTPLYEQECTADEFWEQIKLQLSGAKLTANPVVSLYTKTMRPDLEPLNPDDSPADAGLKLYRSFKDLDTEIIMSPQFWAYLSHRFGHAYLQKNPKKDIRRQYFISDFPRGLYRCNLSGCYLAVKWTDKMLQDNKEANGIFADLPLEKALVWMDQEVLSRMLDRRPFCSSKLRSCVLEILLDCQLKGAIKDKRELVRRFFTSINRIYGGALVEILDRDVLLEMLRSEFVRLQRSL